MIRYLGASVNISGKNICYIMRRPVSGWFAKGLPHSGIFRESVKRISSEDEAKGLIKLYMDSIA